MDGVHVKPFANGLTKFQLPHSTASFDISQIAGRGAPMNGRLGFSWCWRALAKLYSVGGLMFHIHSFRSRVVMTRGGEKGRKITFSCTRGGAAPAGARSSHSTPPTSCTRSAGRAGTFDHAGLAPGDDDLTTTTRRRFVLSSSPFVRPRRHDADRGGRGAPSLAGHSPTTPRQTREGIARGRAQVRHRHGSLRAQLTTPETRVLVADSGCGGAPAHALARRSPMTPRRKQEDGVRGRARGRVRASATPA